MPSKKVVVALLIAVPVLVILMFVLYVHVNNQSFQSDLQHESLRLSTPVGCTANGSHYHAPQYLENTAFMQIDYKCQASGGQLYAEIISNLTKLGYVVNNDKSQLRPHDQFPTQVYEFSYESKQFLASYDFHPNQPSCCTVNGLNTYTSSDLSNIQVTSISLRLD
jgi:hypothetical protein